MPRVRIEFTLDWSDLDRMVAFWTAAAELVVDGVIEGRYGTLTGHRTTLTLQRVPEAKAVKNRMHLDLLVDDLDPSGSPPRIAWCDSSHGQCSMGVRSALVCSQIPKETSSALHPTARPKLRHGTTEVLSTSVSRVSRPTDIGLSASRRAADQCVPSPGTEGDLAVASVGA
jgi:hypothetical protein